MSTPIYRGSIIVGYLYDNATQVVAKDAKGTTKGWFDKQANQTRTANGTFFGNGNQVAALL